MSDGPVLVVNAGSTSLKMSLVEADGSAEPVASLEAGVFWGLVGAVRELLARQTEDLGSDPWVIWTGGDAALLAPPIFGTAARIEPNLILLGLSEVAFGTTSDVPRD